MARVYSFTTANQRNEQFALRKFNRERAEEEELSGIAGSYGLYECLDAANSMAEYLKKKGKKAEIITIVFTGEGRHSNVWSDIKGAVISENGIHAGLLYKETVYCNVHPYGLPETMWTNDFQGFGAKIVQKIPIS